MISTEQQADIDVLIIGAGVVGCAIAERITAHHTDLSVAVLESGPRPAEGITSRNSGVIHAGIYYPPESLKAQACIHGNALLYEWAQKHGVTHKRLAKLIVARGADQKATLQKTYDNALKSGARGLSFIGRDKIKELEPEIDYDEAILSETTGIIDPAELTRSYILAAEERGAAFMYNHAVTAIEHEAGNGIWRIVTPHQEIRTRIVINCAGLHADDIARLASITKYTIHPCRGDYFTLRTPKRFQRLIYPTKDPSWPGLGVHLTIDVSGRYKLGPDTEYIPSKTDFSAADHKHSVFLEAARRLLGPHIEPSQIMYDTCGIRPKLRAPHEPAEKDFVISQDLPGLINLVGIESPGLTASLALAEKVRELL
jgi:L-2-hydroxyglutarate oxidase LhgO